MKRNLHRIAAHTAVSCVVLVGLTVALSSAAGAASPPALHISKGPYHSGQLINLSVGPNGYYKPYSRINILECADPGGKMRNLPNSVSTCDGNTIEGNSILIAKDGSWSETGYQLFALPDVKSLGELANGQPVCNQRHSCVLYIGENQENFTWPKQFSAPFTIKPAHKAKR
jgi:hypothetical protein